MKRRLTSRILQYLCIYASLEKLSQATPFSSSFLRKHTEIAIFPYPQSYLFVPFSFSHLLNLPPLPYPLSSFSSLSSSPFSLILSFRLRGVLLSHPPEGKSFFSRTSQTVWRRPISHGEEGGAKQKIRLQMLMSRSVARTRWPRSPWIEEFLRCPCRREAENKEIRARIHVFQGEGLVRYQGTRRTSEN